MLATTFLQPWKTSALHSVEDVNKTALRSVEDIKTAYFRPLFVLLLLIELPFPADKQKGKAVLADMG